ncbi:hypothetical protein SLOPH_857 [Spraguea lophii 42_110]|uniref:Uncharacterized protein n=1 Tax=Spraguea lophii (strain 42_110) TaxID=1358809 RepID=S7WBP8_SPRLO|nr:hypothetical protein SLOPH_857 [Spraguea lophii 42_110]
MSLALYNSFIAERPLDREGLLELIRQSGYILRESNDTITSPDGSKTEMNIPIPSSYEEFNEFIQKKCTKPMEKNDMIRELLLFNNNLELMKEDDIYKLLSNRLDKKEMEAFKKMIKVEQGMVNIREMVEDLTKYKD